MAENWALPIETCADGTRMVRPRILLGLRTLLSREDILDYLSLDEARKLLLLKAPDDFLKWCLVFSEPDLVSPLSFTLGELLLSFPLRCFMDSSNSGHGGVGMLPRGFCGFLPTVDPGTGTARSELRSRIATPEFIEVSM